MISRATSKGPADMIFKQKTRPKINLPKTATFSPEIDDKVKQLKFEAEEKAQIRDHRERQKWKFRTAKEQLVDVEGAM